MVEWILLLQYSVPLITPLAAAPFDQEDPASRCRGPQGAMVLILQQHIVTLSSAFGAVHRAFMTIYFRNK